MKYVDKGFVGDYEGNRADIIAKPDFSKKDKAAIVGSLGAIALGIYTIAKRFFVAGCIGYNIGEFEALDSLGLIGDDKNGKVKAHDKED